MFCTGVPYFQLIVHKSSFKSLTEACKYNHTLSQRPISVSDNIVIGFQKNKSIRGWKHTVPVPCIHSGRWLQWQLLASAGRVCSVRLYGWLMCSEWRCTKATLKKERESIKLVWESSALMCVPEQAVEAKGHLGTNWDLQSCLPQLPSRWNLCWAFCGWAHPAAFSFFSNVPSLFISIIYASLLLS